jgi:hypothetical protein
MYIIKISADQGMKLLATMKILGRTSLLLQSGVQCGCSENPSQGKAEDESLDIKQVKHYKSDPQYFASGAKVAVECLAHAM